MRKKVGMTLATWCPEVKEGGNNRQLSLMDRLSSTMAPGQQKWEGVRCRVKQWHQRGRMRGIKDGER